MRACCWGCLVGAAVAVLVLTIGVAAALVVAVAVCVVAIVAGLVDYVHQHDGRRHP